MAPLTLPYDYTADTWSFKSLADENHTGLADLPQEIQELILNLAWDNDCDTLTTRFTKNRLGLTQVSRAFLAAEKQRTTSTSVVKHFNLEYWGYKRDIPPYLLVR
ncbi:hypothetical protein LTR17_009642 [Elasticomyces elasticus]|nr:hypothetical protein LTR17_009642 [Elasticomyces elasticus]